jgi:inosose dehydratase
MNDLSRRAFLGSAAAALPFTRAAANPAPIRLGFSLYGMKSLAVPEALKTLAGIGYRGVELVAMPGWPTDPKQLSEADRKDLRKRLLDSQLSLDGLMENLPEPAADDAHKTNLERLKAAAELGHALSPEAPPPIETILGGKPGTWDAVKEKVADRLRAWAEVARAAKTIVAVKPHVGNALQSPEGLLWLLKQIDSPWVKLTYDYSHFAVQGMNLAKTAEQLLPHTAFIHLKDVKGTPQKFEFLLPGTEGIDYAGYAKILRTAKYPGGVVVEVSSQLFNKPGYDPVAAARLCWKNLAAPFGLL